MQQYKHRIRNDYKFYSQDLRNTLFKQPYTKIEFIQQDLGVSRITDAGYLNRLASDGLLKKLDTANYYIIDPLYQIFLKAQ